ncbi:beta-lactamase domain-containing protein [Pyricularia oryzae]|nr:beta-lactamase domain-containing protein [Pyricularia oryzae]
MSKRQTRPPGTDPLKTLRILNPYPGIFAYYDGRTGERFHSDQGNWLDDGAFTLGVATYSIVSGDTALLYDAAITEPHAEAMITHLKSMGVTKTTTVYSHFHTDHVAGAGALQRAGTNFTGHELTVSTLKNRAASYAALDPPIPKVFPPTTTYKDVATVQVGDRTVEMHHFHVHTTDGTVLYLPQEKILFAGDTLEDTATFIAEPDSIGTHITELQRMATLPIDKILPAHGSPDRIAAGGYGPEFINATVRYLNAVNSPVARPPAWSQKLQEVVKDDVAAGNLIYFAQYEEVHQSNVQSIQRLRHRHEALIYPPTPIKQDMLQGTVPLEEAAIHVVVLPERKLYAGPVSHARRDASKLRIMIRAVKHGIRRRPAPVRRVRPVPLATVLRHDVDPAVVAAPQDLGHEPLAADLGAREARHGRPVRYPGLRERGARRLVVRVPVQHREEPVRAAVDGPQLGRLEVDRHGEGQQRRASAHAAGGDQLNVLPRAQLPGTSFVVLGALPDRVGDASAAGPVRLVDDLRPQTGDALAPAGHRPPLPRKRLGVRPLQGKAVPPVVVRNVAVAAGVEDLKGRVAHTVRVLGREADRRRDRGVGRRRGVVARLPDHNRRAPDAVRVVVLRVPEVAAAGSLVKHSQLVSRVSVKA